MKFSTFLVPTFLVMSFPAIHASPPASPLTLWYLKPAANAVNEALPIGNGSMGGLVFGGRAEEIVALNVDSLWTGDDNPSGGYDHVHFGDYLALGDLRIHLPGHEGATNYRRDLDNDRDYFCSHPAQVMVVHLTAAVDNGSFRLLTPGGARMACWTIVAM